MTEIQELKGAVKCGELGKVLNVGIMNKHCRGDVLDMVLKHWGLSKFSVAS